MLRGRIKEAGLKEVSCVSRVLSPLTPTLTQRSAKVLKLMDSDKDGQISFSEFVRYNRKFPSILFPAFNMQQKMRFKVLGLPFWQV